MCIRDRAASLKKTQKDTKARVVLGNGTEKTILSSELKKGDIVMVSAGEIIPGDGEVIEGIASVDESAITGESAPVAVSYTHLIHFPMHRICICLFVAIKKLWELLEYRPDIIHHWMRLKKI